MRRRAGTSPAPTIILLSVLLLSLAGCGEDIVYIDPPVDYDPPPPFEPQGEPGLTIGEYSEQIFTPLDAGGELPIIFGFQGGTWIMPAIQTTGLHFLCTMSGDVTTESGERIGFLIDSPVRLDRTPSGTLDTEALPIPIGHLDDPDEPIDDLYDINATIEIRIVDELGTEVVGRLDVFLIRG